MTTRKSATGARRVKPADNSDSVVEPLLLSVEMLSASTSTIQERLRNAYTSSLVNLFSDEMPNQAMREKWEQFEEMMEPLDDANGILLMSDEDAVKAVKLVVSLLFDLDLKG
jgi:hypothetical protein